MAKTILAVKHSVNRSVLRPLWPARTLSLAGAATRRDPVAWRRLTSGRPTTCPRRLSRRPATSDDDPASLRFHGKNRSTSSGSLATRLRARRQVRRQPRTRIQVPQAQRLQQREHHRRQTARPHRTRAVVVLPPHHRPTLAPAPPCCCPSAPRGARRTPSDPSSGSPGSPAPSAAPGATAGPASSASPCVPNAVTAARSARRPPRTPPAPPGPPAARR